MSEKELSLGGSEDNETRCSATLIVYQNKKERDNQSKVPRSRTKENKTRQVTKNFNRRVIVGD